MSEKTLRHITSAFRVIKDVTPEQDSAADSWETKSASDASLGPRASGNRARKARVLPLANFKKGAGSAGLRPKFKGGVQQL